jgi:hypothetical protein
MRTDMDDSLFDNEWDADHAGCGSLPILTLEEIEQYKAEKVAQAKKAMEHLRAMVEAGL